MPDSTPPPVIVAVIGSRTFNNYIQLSRELDQLALTTPVAGLSSGGSTGADTLAEKYAIEKNVPITIFRPDYKTYGRRAPLVRNVQIVKSSQLVVAFHDGKSRGTLHALTQARRLGIAVRVITPEPLG